MWNFATVVVVWVCFFLLNTMQTLVTGRIGLNILFHTQRVSLRAVIIVGTVLALNWLYLILPRIGMPLVTGVRMPWAWFI
jgi:hypothetical protein